MAKGESKLDWARAQREARYAALGKPAVKPKKMTLPGGAVVEVKSVARGGRERRPVTPEEMDAELAVGEPCPTCGQVVKGPARTAAEKQRAYRARKKGEG